MKSGDYGDYTWGRGEVFTRGPERVGPSGRRAAKKAAKAARKRGESPPRVQPGLPRPGAVAEVLRMLVLSGAAYVGFQPARSREQFDHLERIADAFGLAVELRGGGRGGTPWCAGRRARARRRRTTRASRARWRRRGRVRPRGNWEGYRGARAGARADRDKKTERKTLASNFVSAGVMRGGSGSEDGARAKAARAKAAVSRRSPLTPTTSPTPTTRRRPRRRASNRPPISSSSLPPASRCSRGEDARPSRRTWHPTGAAPRRGAAEREARLLESRRRKLGIRVGDPSSSGVGARGASSAGRTVGAGEAFGAFEKHTSGFGSRMLAKMGFQGEGSGVGKGGTGIAEPVAAVTRAKRVGLGAEKRR